MSTSASDVLAFWFGAPESPGYGQQRAAWFRKDAAFDAEIARRFEPLIVQALRGELSEWTGEAESALARILLLDQFTRNIYRDTAQAFAGDALALAAATAMVAAKQDRSLLPVQRMFVYLPFEHAEDLGRQDESLRLFTQLERDAPTLTGLLDYAQRHHAVIARFGRFPHRNDQLGRVSTAEEVAFLQQPGSLF